VQSTARGHEGQLDNIVRTRIRWGLLATLIAGTMSAYYFFQGNSGLGASFAVVAAFMPFYGVYFSYFFYLQGKQLFDQAALTQAAARVIFMVVMITTALVAPTATYLIAAYMFATIAMQYAGYVWTKKKHQEEPNIDQEAIDYGKYLTLWNATPNTIATQIGIVAIWYFLGDVESAIYAVAMMIPMEANRFGAILNQVAMPKLAKQEIDISALFRKILKLEVILIAIWALYAVSASYIFALFFPKYPEAVGLSIVAMLMVLLVPRMILKGLISAKKMKRAIQKVSLTIPALQIVLTLTLIPLLGVTGAIAATVIAWLVEYTLLAYLIQYKNEK
jgi:O-antigen/teichoic acid export membrane protein